MQLAFLEYSEKLGKLSLLILLGLLVASITIALKMVGLSAAQIPELVAVRLPHVLLVILVGAALSLSGALMQSLFANPLADPYLAGTSSTAAVAAWIASAWSIGSAYSLLTLFAPQIAAALASMGVAYVVYKASQLRGRTMVVGMVLLGVGINAACWALLVCMDLLAPQVLLHNREFWLWGSFSNATWSHVGCAASTLCIMGIITKWLVPHLETLRLGQVTAKHLGVQIKPLRWAVLVCVGLSMTSIAHVGCIGMISLWAPSIARLLVGHNANRYILPASALLGATCLLWLDMLSHASMLAYPLPVGLLSTFLGVPFFIASARRERFYVGG